MLTPVINYAAPVNMHHPLNRGLVAWWKVLPGRFRSLRWRDLVQQRVGTLVAGPVWSGTTRRGGYGELRCDGTDDYLNVTGLTIASGLDKTFALWVRPTSMTGSRFLLDSETGRLVLALQDIGVQADTISFYDGAWQESGVAATLNVWQHVTFVFQGSIGRIYKDGVQFGGDLTYAPKAIGGTTALMTNYFLAGNHFQGAFDDVRVMNRALATAEVQWLYRESSQPVTRLLRYLPLDMSRGTAAVPAPGSLALTGVGI